MWDVSIIISIFFFNFFFFFVLGFWGVEQAKTESLCEIEREKERERERERERDVFGGKLIE